MKVGLKIAVFVLMLDFAIIASVHMTSRMKGEGSSFKAEFNSSELSSYSTMTGTGAKINESQTRYAENLGKESVFSKLSGGLDVVGSIGQFFAWIQSFIRLFALPVLIWNRVFPAPTGVMLFVKQLIQGVFTILNFLLIAALVQFVRGGDI